MRVFLMSWFFAMTICATIYSCSLDGQPCETNRDCFENYTCTGKLCVAITENEINKEIATDTEPHINKEVIEDKEDAGNPEEITKPDELISPDKTEPTPDEPTVPEEKNISEEPFVEMAPEITPDENKCPNVGKDCKTGLKGVCNDGKYVCENNQEVCKSTTSATAEKCDGLDNDCNGFIDENLPNCCTNGQTRSCGPAEVGQCKKGIQTCANSTWGECKGKVDPSMEVCDNIDNDCDGQVDNVDKAQTDNNLAHCGKCFNVCPQSTSYLQYTCQSGTCVGKGLGIDPKTTLVTYDCENSTNGLMLDRSGNNNYANFTQIQPGPTMKHTPGLNGNSCELDENGYILSSILPSKIATARTFMFWHKATKVKHFGYLLHIKDDTPGIRGVNSSGLYMQTVFDSTGTIGEVNLGAPNLNKWVFYAIAYPFNMLSVCVYRGIEGEKSVTKVGCKTSILLKLGSEAKINGDGSGPRCNGGLYDNIIITTKSMTESEINAVYQAQHP